MNSNDINHTQLKSNQFIDIDDFILQKKVGKGVHGKVFIVKEKKTGQNYAAKIAHNRLDSIYEDSINISRNIDIISRLHHPMILNIIGYSPINFKRKPKPVIITELSPNGSLADLIKSQGESNIVFDDTLKLIIIYGIASSIAYLHDCNIIHCDLKPTNILINDFMLPKIADFCLSNDKSTCGIKGTPLYISPEIWEKNEYTKACDVYAFSIIVYEIMTNEVPFKNVNYLLLPLKVKEGHRPEFKKQIPQSYRSLIELCWSNNPKDRPSFHQILSRLKNDQGFITESVNEKDFFQFIKYIDQCENAFDSSMPQNSITFKSETFTQPKIKKNNKKPIKIIQNDPNDEIMYDLRHYNLEEFAKQILENTHDKSKILFLLGMNLIEGRDRFPQNTQLGINYLLKAMEKRNEDSFIYYINMLIKGKIISKNHPKARKLNEMHFINKESIYYEIQGKILKDEKDYSLSKDMFLKSIEKGSIISKYEYGCLLIKTETDKVTKEEGIRFIKESADEGYNKAEYKYGKMIKNHEIESDEDFVTYIKRSANGGYLKSIYLYSKILEEMNNHSEALIYLQLARQKGYVEAMYQYALRLIEDESNENSLKEALSLFKKASNQGHIDSMFYYGVMHIKGNGVQVNIEKGTKYIKRSVKNGCKLAYAHYAMMLDFGIGVSVNKQEAAHYYKLAIEQLGNADAMTNYANMLITGNGIPIDKNEGIKYLKMAIEKGNSDAMNKYGKMLLEGDGIPTNKDEAAKYFKMAIDNGNYISANNYASILLKYNGNKEEASKYFKIAIDNRNPQAMLNYGLMLSEGNGIPMNKEKAEEYFKMAIETGNSEVIYSYAFMLFNGNRVETNEKESFGQIRSTYDCTVILQNGDEIEEDKNKSLEYYKKAAEQTYKKAILLLEEDIADKEEVKNNIENEIEQKEVDIMHNYGCMLYKGQLFPMDRTQAAKYFKMAADFGKIESMLNYAVMALNSNGIPINKKEASKYFKMAADKGQVNSMYNYALMLQIGDGIEIDKKESVRYYKKAAENGHIDSMHNYGTMLYAGDGIEEDKAEAFKYFKEAAEKGHIQSAYNCAVMLQIGDGIEFDKTKSKMYLEEVIKQAMNNNANKKREYVNKFFDPQNFVRYDDIVKFQRSKFFEVTEQQTGKYKIIQQSSIKLENYTRKMLIDCCSELRIISSIIHPSIFQFCGYCPVNFKNITKPMILYENAPNGTLNTILEREANKEVIPGWNDTKKLINIYGIASAMSFLHSHDIIHNDLNPQHIFLDKSYYPKLSGFRFSKENFGKQNLDEAEIKGEMAYQSPEVLRNFKYSKANDVYSFSLIAYEIIMNVNPLLHISNIKDLVLTVCYDKKRPEFKRPIANSYRILIEKCWSENSEERPTFDEIIDELKKNDQFITETVDKKEYQQYIQYIEDSTKIFKPNQGIQQLEELLLSNPQQFLEIKIDNKLHADNDSKIPFNLQNYTIVNDIPSLNYNLKYNFIEHIVKEKERNIKLQSKTFAIEIHQFLRHEIVNFCREINILAQLNHPAILKFVGYSSIDFKNRPYPTIITEYCDSINTLREIIHDKSGNYNEVLNFNKRIIILFGIASAMSYLHSHNILHRDLKPENIYLDKHHFPKLYGFSISKEIAQNETCKSHNLKGTPAYLAPEVLRDNKYSKSSDVYSFAIVMYEIITGEKPYSEYQIINEFYHDMCNKGVRPKFTKPILIYYQNLIERCWSEDPQLRPSFETIVSELKNNLKFINNSYDKEDYCEYIKFIEEYPVTFEPSKKIQQLDEIISKKINTFQEFDIDIGIKNLYTTEPKNLSFNEQYFDLNNYETVNEIGHIPFYSVSLIKNKKTGKFFVANEAYKTIDIFYIHEITNFSQELNIILQLNHPSILKLIGHSFYNFAGSIRPVIITEFASKESLEDILKQQRSGKINNKWNDTKKLINIYGIASAMLYLHSHDILHRDLKPENVLLDCFYYPKLSGFHISIENSSDINHNENKMKIKGTPAYLAPEIMSDKKYSKLSDVYSFALIVYEIITNKKSFEELLSPKEIKNEVCTKSRRPIIPDSVPKIYRKLIEKCWSQNPEERPTFERIVNELQINREFLIESIDEKEYFQYLDLIDKSPITFNSHKKIQQLTEFFQTKTWLFPEYFSDISIPNTYSTELNNISFDCDIVQISNYKKTKYIYKDEILSSFDICEIILKETKSIYLSKIFKNKEYFLNELNICLKMNHLSFLQFIGCSPVDFDNKPYPVIIYENAQNGSLSRLLELANKNEINDEWTDTKKLIILYGISSGMSLLHSFNIVHCNLKPENIFLDKFLFPKITGFEKSNESLSKTDNDDFLIVMGKKGTYTPYDAPEIADIDYYNTSLDVYSYGLIAYHILTNEKPFSQYIINSLESDIYENVSKGERPEFKQPIADCYRKLIERCWSQNPNERPTFEEISAQLRSNKEFITEKINQEEYYSYIKYIEGAQILKNMNQPIETLNDFIQTKNYTFRQVKIDFLKMKSEPIVQFSIDMGSINLNKYIKQSKIGSGSFGNVYKVKNKDTGEICAAKVSIYELDQCPDDIIINFLREINNLSQLNHPTIMKFIGYNQNDFKNKPKPVILTEFVPYGSLDKIIELERNNCGNHNWNDTKRLINIYGIARGMQYVHENDIIHRDLKPGNILLDENLYPKIADFGLSKSGDDKYNTIPSGLKGTYAYCPPEVLFKLCYGFKSDVYAYGMIVYEIMTNEIPYEGCNLYQLIYKLQQGDQPKYKYPLPYCYKKLIKKCLSKEHCKRPYFDEIVKTLETNKDFITQNVDEKEFLNYISFIKDADEQKEKKNAQKENEIVQNINDNQIEGLTKINESDFEDNEKIDEFENQEINDSENHLDEEIDEEADITKENFLQINIFERGTIISKTSFSKVYIFKDKKDGSQYLGQMTMIKIKSFSKKKIDNLRNEIKVLTHVNHPSLLKFIGFSPFDFKGQQKPVIVSEYAANGTLSHILEIEREGKNLQGWNTTKKMIVVYGIASAMLYLHNIGIIHRSLCPDNIFLDEILAPKLGYFGITSQFYEKDQMSHQSTTTGFSTIPIYSSPESIVKNEFTKASDVYAFAFIVYELLMVEKPFDGLNDTQIIQNIIVDADRPKMDGRVPMNIRELIEKCWLQDAENRPTFDEIVFFLKNDDQLMKEIPDKEDYIKYIKFIDESQGPAYIFEK